MGGQLNFLLNKALQYIQSRNLDAAALVLKQIVKNKPNHSEAFRLLAFIASQQGKNEIASTEIKKAISADKRNGLAYSNQGNIQLNMGMTFEAIASYEMAIKLMPAYAEAYSNLGNAYQELNEISKAIDLYKKAISIDQNNPEFFCNLGNAFWKIDSLKDARESYDRSLELAPNHANSLHNLSHLDLREFNFTQGWNRYESRWFVDGQDTPKSISTSKPLWDGEPRANRLLIWGEQGIGDQILYSSMLNSLDQYPQAKIVSVDKKLVHIFQRSFPNIKILDKDIEIPEEFYDEQIPMASLGKFFRPDIKSFKNARYPYLLVNCTRLRLALEGAVKCGLSWKSGRAKLGVEKSVPLIDLSEVLNLKNINFVNLQYGEVKDEICEINTKLGMTIQTIEDINLYDDVDAALSVLDACNLVVTTSNTTAHLAGALGKETLLMLPCGNSRFWYWHDIDGISLWYPSVRVFKQEQQGDWSKPIQAVKAYLENRVGV